MPKLIVVLLILLSLPATVLAQQCRDLFRQTPRQHAPPFSVTALAQQRQDPYSGVDDVARLVKGKSVGLIRGIIAKKLKAIEQQCQSGGAVEAEKYCEAAELMKYAGDYRAKALYCRAIEAAANEPFYEYLLAEYLRNFRGALHPLFPEAEKHYEHALLKLAQLKQQNNARPFDLETEKRTQRGLAALSQTDGFPMLHRKSHLAQPEIPVFYLTTTFDYASNTSDFDHRSEVRDFTSELLLIQRQIEAREQRSLMADELRGMARSIARSKDQFETFNRVRFRYGDLPAIDVSIKRRELDQSQITRFDRPPSEFNDVTLTEYGVALEKPIDAQTFDLFFRGSFKRARRVGLIEFLPHNQEDINQFEAHAVLSRSVGPDKVNFEFTHVFQAITEDRPPQPLKRDRSLDAGKFTYQLFRTALHRAYASRFDLRGIDFYGGALHDNETFGTIDVNRNDYFVGAAVRGLGKLDLTVQPTIFTSDVERNPALRNSQFRTNATVLIRLLDEEKQPGNPAFLHVMIPFSRDLAMTGPNTFENYKIGAGLNAKLFTLGRRRATFLAAIRYDYQDFHRLRKGLHLYSLNFSMGF